MSELLISQRAAEMPMSAVRKLVPLAQKAKARGVHVYHLNVGQPDIVTPSAFWQAVRDFPEETLAYAPSGGRPECVEGFLEYYARFDIELAPEDIIVTTAGCEAVLFALLVVGDVGDEIIVPEPYYSNYNGIANVTGLRLVPFTTYARDGYHLPPREEIEFLVGERTRAILYSSPGNPTGVVYTRDEVAMLGEIARDHGLFLLSDEVYREFTYDGQIATSVFHIPDLGEQAVILDSVSKRYSACGARVGCVVSRNEAFMDAIMKLAMMRLSAPALEQIGAAACMLNLSDYFDEISAEYTRRRDIVVERMNDVEDVICPRPTGAFYAMVKIEGVDTEDFARWLLADFEQDGETVMVAPGAGFYGTLGLGRDEIRIAYVLETGKLARAMDLLATAIRRYRNERT